MEIRDKIIVATDFSDHPGARYKTDGACSGEQFLDDWLRPKFDLAVKNDYLLLIDLDKVFGYPSSFVSGSFGKLSEEKGSDLLLKYIRFKSDESPVRLEKIIKEIKDPKRK